MAFAEGVFFPTAAWERGKATRGIWVHRMQTAPSDPLNSECVDEVDHLINALRIENQQGR